MFATRENVRSVYSAARGRRPIQSMRREPGRLRQAKKTREPERSDDSEHLGSALRSPLREYSVSVRPQSQSILQRTYRSSVARYLAVGGVSFGIDFGLLWVLRDAVGLQLWLATATAFLVSFAFNYTIQRAFAFSSRSRHRASLVKYTALVGFNTVATVGIVELVDAFGGGWPLGKVVATAASTVWNYFAYRHIVFVDRTERASDPAAASIATTEVDEAPGGQTGVDGTPRED